MKRDRSQNRIGSGGGAVFQFRLGLRPRCETKSYIREHVRESSICCNAVVVGNGDGMMLNGVGVGGNGHGVVWNGIFVVGNGDGVMVNGDDVLGHGDVAVKKKREDPDTRGPKNMVNKKRKKRNLTSQSKASGRSNRTMKPFDVDDFFGYGMRKWDICLQSSPLINH